MRIMRVMVCVLAGCGSVSEERPDGAVTQTDSATTVDASSPDSAMQLGAFGAPTKLMPVSTDTYVEDDPSMTGDGLELYFATTRPENLGGEDIWVSKRASTNDAWGTPEPAAGLNSTAADGTGEVSADGLTFWMVSTRDGQSAASDIYVSTRANRTLSWTTPQLATELNTISDERAPRVSNDGLTMYLISNRAGGTTGSDIYRVSRSAVGAVWGVPERVAALSTASTEMGAAPALGETNIVFARDMGASGHDLFEVSRTGTTFGTPRIMSELNTTDDENDVDLSEDARTLLFAKNGDIYIATR